MPDAELTAVSYNIHSAIGRDGAFAPERVLEVIHALDADIVALQEVDARVGEPARFDQFRFFAEATGMQVVAGPNIAGHRGDYGNLLLTRLPLRDSRLIDLSLRRREPRGAIIARLDAEGTALDVVCTHLGLWPGERRAQVAKLAAALGSAPPATLFLGDFNVWRRSARLLAPLGAPQARAVSPLTWPAAWPLFALDRIWSRPAGLIRSVDAVRNALTLAASDHLPLRARLRLAACRT